MTLFGFYHDDVIKWKLFPRYWPFVRGIHRSPVNSPHKGQWRGALVFSLICAWMNGWVNTREAGEERCHRTHYDVRVMHSSDIIKSAMASQITGVLIVYLIVCSGADQRKHQSFASLAFVRRIHRWPVNSPHKGPVTRKMFLFDDVIMSRPVSEMSVVFRWHFPILQHYSFTFGILACPQRKCKTFQCTRVTSWRLIEYYKIFTNESDFQKLPLISQTFELIMGTIYHSWFCQIMCPLCAQYCTDLENKYHYSFKIIRFAPSDFLQPV